MLFFKLGLRILSKNIKPYQIRGFVGNKFKEEILLHHHIDKNKFLYRYPLIQYKRVNNDYFIIGLNEGAYVLKKIWDKIDILKIYNKEVEIIEKSLEHKEIAIAEDKKQHMYSFITPWLALNQKNYKEFKLLLFEERRRKLERILINNVLSFCKAINYTVKDRLTSSIEVQVSRAQLKGIEMVAFRGVFKINFLLPDYIGLGKSISRGFGTIMRI